MRQVRVHLSLVGNSKRLASEFTSDQFDSPRNDTILDMVKERVRFHFGNRSLLVHNEDSLEFAGIYPSYYAAVWFVSEDTPTSGTDLIVLGHGESAKSAQSSAMDAVRMANWSNIASTY